MTEEGKCRRIIERLQQELGGPPGFYTINFEALDNLSLEELLRAIRNLQYDALGMRHPAA